MRRTFLLPEELAKPKEIAKSKACMDVSRQRSSVKTKNRCHQRNYARNGRRDEVNVSEEEDSTDTFLSDTC
jgi:hypothetical protein